MYVFVCVKTNLVILFFQCLIILTKTSLGGKNMTKKSKCFFLLPKFRIYFFLIENFFTFLQRVFMFDFYFGCIQKKKKTEQENV